MSYDQLAIDTLEHDDMGIITNFLSELEIDTSQPGWVDKFGQKLRNLTSSDKSKIRTLSLFSGAGGLDIGFHDAGFEIIEMVEIEKRFTETLAANSKTGRIFSGSKINTVDIREYCPTDIGKIDFIIGGPPCQTFSAAGRRAAGVKGIDDPRGLLFQEYVRLLDELKPKAFLFENVYAILGAQGGEPWKLINRSFNEAGYRLFFRILDAADYGVPQHRERLIIIGIKDEQKSFLFPAPTHGPDSRIGLDYYKAGEAVADFPKDTDQIFDGLYGHYLKEIPPGLNYSFFTKKLGHPNPAFGWRSKFSDFLYKADPTMPVRAIKAQGGKYTGPFSWESRHFTVNELKRLQTFPDEYELIGNRSVAVHQIGNSVPPQFARMLAIAVRKQIFNKDLPFEIPLLKNSDTLGFRTRKRKLSKKYQEIATEAIKKIKTKKANVSIKDTYQQYFLDDKHLLTEKEGNGTRIFIHSVLLENSWIVTVSDDEDADSEEEAVITTFIQPVRGSQWEFSFSNIELRLRSGHLLNYLAGWKFIEAQIKKYLGYEDLVQFSGYYQYASNLSITNQISPQEKRSIHWKLIDCLIANHVVGTELSLTEFAELIDEKPTDTLDALRMLKLYGYEVRSKNTNPQISADHFIIPYAFPTLTSRKVQFSKGL